MIILIFSSKFFLVVVVFDKMIPVKNRDSAYSPAYR